MKYTFFAKRGTMYKPGLHYLYIGGWVRPSPDFIVLAHGNMTSMEYARILKDGYCKIFFEAHYHILRIYQQTLEWHAARYQDEHGRTCGLMTRSKRCNNLYIGKIDINMIRGCL